MTTTAAPSAAAVEPAPPSGYWQREASHNPRPLTPMCESFFRPAFNAAFARTFEEFGLLADGLEYATVNGYVYTRVKPLGGRESSSLPPAPLLWLLVRVVPMFRKRTAAAREALRGRLDLKMARRWYDEWRPQLIADIERYRAAPLASMSDDALATHLREAREWFNHTCLVHFYLSGANGLPLARLIFFLRDELGYGDMETLRLLSGLSGASSEPAVALGRLGDAVRSDNGMRDAVLAAAPRDVASVLRGRNAGAADAYDAYVRDYGFRALRYEVVEQTLGEHPELVGQLLQDELRQQGNMAERDAALAVEREQAKQETLALLKTPELRTRFEELLADAVYVYPIREDNEFYTISVPFAVMRTVLLEAGERLAARGVIGARDDIFFLTSDEAIAALEGRTASENETVQARRAAFREWESWDAPASYGEPPPQPPLSILPSESREAMEAMIYLQEKIFEAEASGVVGEVAAGQVHGRAAARGTYTGTARVIMGEEQFGRLENGDVLVCPITSPVWSVLFAKVGALVTDSGGILSHPAIIAREYRIPAVVATGNATTLIRDGQRVEVDGDAGIVRILG